MTSLVRHKNTLFHHLPTIKNQNSTKEILIYQSLNFSIYHYRKLTPLSPPTGNNSAWFRQSKVLELSLRLFVRVSRIFRISQIIQMQISIKLRNFTKKPQF